MLSFRLMKAFHCLLSVTYTVGISFPICPGAWRITHADGFVDLEWNWCISLLLTFHWPDLTYTATLDCKEGEEEESNTNFVEELAVLATEHIKAFGTCADMQ